LSLESVSHYHQRHGIQPSPMKIASGYERVELMTGGRGWIEDQGQWREVNPGDLIWNCAGDMTIGRSDLENPYRCLAVSFRLSPTRQRRFPRFSFWPDLEAVSKLADEATRLFINGQFDRLTLLNYLHGLLVFQIRRHEHAAQTERYPQRIRAVMDLIRSHYASKLTLHQLARQAACSTAHLHDLFLQHTGTSPHQWLIQQRLKVAKEKLVGSLDSMKQIAQKCGFSDAAAFAHAFKAHTGRSPGAFRKHYFNLV